MSTLCYAAAWMSCAASTVGDGQRASDKSPFGRCIGNFGRRIFGGRKSSGCTCNHFPFPFLFVLYHMLLDHSGSMSFQLALEEMRMRKQRELSLLLLHYQRGLLFCLRLRSSSFCLASVINLKFSTISIFPSFTSAF